MKKLLLSLSLVFFAAFSFSQTEPKLKFTTLTIENNSIPYGADYSFEFPFKNTTKEYVKIEDVKRSCGCTTPYFPADSIKPGKKDKIIAKYDTKRVGGFTKTLTVVIKDSDPVVLTIKGTVLPEVQPVEITPKKD
jgi:hypothetical protein